MSSPTHAELRCRQQHFWCPTHEVEVCALARSITVKHERCKLRPLEPKREEAAS